MSRLCPNSVLRVKTEDQFLTPRALVPWYAPPLLALQFLTRVPVPGIRELPVDVVRAGLARSTGWFPLVGALMGLVTAMVVAGCDIWWPRTVAVLVALIVEARLTGAFHEDAVADTCDALGGGRDPAHVREIMKDSRIGSYGASGLLLAVSLRAVLMVQLPAEVLFAGIVVSAGFARFLAVTIMRVVPPALAAQGIGKDIGDRVASRDIALAAVLVVPLLAWLGWMKPWSVVGAFAIAAAFVAWYRRLLLRKVGGSTGDCLGFAAYAGQLIVLLCVVAEWAAA